MAQQESLPRRVIKSLLYSGVSNALVKLFSGVSIFITLKLLDPTEFGVASLVLAIFTIIQAITELGLGLALIQKQDVTREKIDSLFWTSLILSVGIYVIILGVSPLIAWFYEEEELTALLRVYGLGVIIFSLYVVPRNLLMKELKFGQIAVIESVPSLSGAITMIVLAYHGFGPWAIICNELVNRSCQLVFSHLFRPYLPRMRLKFKAIRDMVFFGLYATGSRLLFNFYRNTDYLIVGKVFGMEAVAVYTLAFRLTADPVHTLASNINKVAYPTFAMLQTNPRRIRRYLFALSRASLIIIGAVLIFIAFHLEWTLQVLGLEKYMDSVPLVHILVLMGAIRAISPLLPQLLNAVGKAKLNFYYSLVCAIVVPATLYVGAQFGLSGVAWAWVFIYPVVFILLCWFASRQVELSLSRFVVGLFAGILVLVPIVPMGLGLRYVLAPLALDRPGIALAISASAMTAFGLLFAWLMERENLKLLWKKPEEDAKPTTASGES